MPRGTTYHRYYTWLSVKVFVTLVLLAFSFFRLSAGEPTEYPYYQSIVSLIAGYWLHAAENNTPATRVRPKDSTLHQFNPYVPPSNTPTASDGGHSPAHDPVGP